MDRSLTVRGTTRSYDLIVQIFPFRHPAGPGYKVTAGCRAVWVVVG